ncbi:MAG: ABC transporter ATP-binding protein [Eggerthellaceae bacterium]|nr:ABC transporter ATP-binding protein [Eggerthellaceae bacterium]
MIKVEHLTKRYGDLAAVDDLSFEIDEGHVYGFLGPNGAGKSTTMNIMTGCLSATEGTVTIGGFDIFEEPEKAKRLIGYLPEQPPLYLNETPREYLTFVGEAKGFRGAALEDQIVEAIWQTGIEDVCDNLISTLSKGYRQRVGIAQALLGDPKVVILDEPTVGLDPLQIIEMRSLIKELGRTHTVILSSHILSEVQATCDLVLIISKGRLIAFDEPENLEKVLAGSSGVELLVEAFEAHARNVLERVEHLAIRSCEARGDQLVSIDAEIASGDVRDVCRNVFFACARNNVTIIEMKPKKTNLEDVFIELTESDVDDGDLDGTGAASRPVTSSLGDPAAPSPQEAKEVVACKPSSDMS